MRAQRILIADDDPDFLEFARRVVSDALPQATLSLAKDGEQAYRAILDGGCDLALLDLDTPKMSAMEIVASLRAEMKPPRVVVMTAVGGAADWKVLAALGVDAFLHESTVAAVAGHADAIQFGNVDTSSNRDRILIHGDGSKRNQRAGLYAVTPRMLCVRLEVARRRRARARTIVVQESPVCETSSAL